MKHRILTCKNHPELRWSAKEIAIGGVAPGDPARYNGCRHIFYNGRTTGEMFPDSSGVRCIHDTHECDCSASDLIIAPEDPLVQ